MNYIGSKNRLLSEIKKLLSKYKVPCDGKAVDLFSGTGVVSQLFKQMGYHVVTNDLQYYSYILCKSYLSFDDLPSFQHFPDAMLQIPDVSVSAYNVISLGRQLASSERCVGVLGALLNLPEKEGDFYHYYCEGGRHKRQYFSRQNGLKLQAMREGLDHWLTRRWITEQEFDWLLGCVIEMADRVANTASVYGAYLKHLKATATVPIAPIALLPVSSAMSLPHQHFCQDSLSFARMFQEPVTLTYIDPPYNHRQYGANYHVLETLARWDLDRFLPRGVTGLRPSDEQKSVFCSKRFAKDAFSELLNALDTQYVLFSYNNEGLLTDHDIEMVLKSHYDVITFKRITYPRYRSDSEQSDRVYKARSTQEFLVLAKRIV